MSVQHFHFKSSFFLPLLPSGILWEPSPARCSANFFPLSSYLLLLVCRRLFVSGSFETLSLFTFSSLQHSIYLSIYLYFLEVLIRLLFIDGVEKLSLWNYLKDCNWNRVLRADLWMLFMYRKYSLRVSAVCNLQKKEGNENCTLFCWLAYQYESGSIT